MKFWKEDPETVMQSPARKVYLADQALEKTLPVPGPVRYAMNNRHIDPFDD